ncbi:MAG: sodium-dependent transporter [Simkaniaceae bacterium]|nr:sodium-dependent transporter [Candidatus Sacchlamyda saccharinae]
MREQWRSKLGFIWSAVGSAVGLGSIWRFPYVVGENGGATFIFLYLICLVIIGIPVLISELTIGRKTQLSPKGAFQELGKWGPIGKGMVFTGFLVSTFYGVISGWTFGYLFQALKGGLTSLSSGSEASQLFADLTASPIWAVGYLALFMLVGGYVLYAGVQKGIEKGNKIMVPLLVVVLILLAIKGLTLPGGTKGIAFLFKPDWSMVSGAAILMALGQAFFSLSLGQGTMVTYGSYLSQKENLTETCFPISFFGVIISLLAGVAIFTIVFAVGVSPSSGESLMFQTLPLIFSQMKGGYFLCLLFFVLLFLAAMTSQISALEPAISYLIDEKKWKRKKAVIFVVVASFLVGVPSALSFGVLKDVNIFDQTIFSAVLNLCINILIPLGGLAAVLLVGWRWGIKKALHHMETGSHGLFKRFPFLRGYFRIGIKYVAPVIILIIMLDALGLF